MSEDKDAGSKPNEAGVTIEVTPEMIEAGIGVYLEWCPDSGAGDRTDQQMVKEIYDAMCHAKRQDLST